MRRAIVHDWLTVYGGAERVLEQMLEVYPDADLFSLIDFLPAGERGFIKDKEVKTSYLQKLPFAAKKYRHYLPLMPMAIERFDLSGYDLVMSSSSAVAKGVITGPDQLHVCMCYSPVRYAWDLQHQYLKETGLNRGLKGWYARKILHNLRVWDYYTAAGVDRYIAISEHIACRIEKFYRRESVVICPPVDVHSFVPGESKSDYYLAVSRMVPYKKMVMIVEAFSKMPDKKLVVIGDGPELKKVTAQAGKNVRVLGYQPFEVVLEHMQKAKAFVFAALEDFGIVPLEAQACGTPVIAYGRGGALETVNGSVEKAPTGVFFHSQDTDSLIEAVAYFEQEESRFSAEACRQNAMRFAPERFRTEFRTFVEEALLQFQSR